MKIDEKRACHGKVASAPQSGVQEVSSMSFESALSELERITTLLERGDVELDKAVRCYERACALREHCQKKLDDAQMKVEKLLHKDGVVSGRAVVDPGVIQDCDSQSIDSGKIKADSECT